MNCRTHEDKIINMEQIVGINVDKKEMVVNLGGGLHITLEGTYVDDYGVDIKIKESGIDLQYLDIRNLVEAYNYIFNQTWCKEWQNGNEIKGWNVDKKELA